MLLAAEMDACATPTKSSTSEVSGCLEVGIYYVLWLPGAYNPVRTLLLSTHEPPSWVLNHFFAWRIWEFCDEHRPSVP